jgi:hypothetical protein
MQTIFTLEQYFNSKGICNTEQAGSVAIYQEVGIFRRARTTCCEGVNVIPRSLTLPYAEGGIERTWLDAVVLEGTHGVPNIYEGPVCMFILYLYLFSWP